MKIASLLVLAISLSAKAESVYTQGGEEQIKGKLFARSGETTNKHVRCLLHDMILAVNPAHPRSIYSDMVVGEIIIDTAALDVDAKLTIEVNAPDALPICAMAIVGTKMGRTIHYKFEIRRNLLRNSKIILPLEETEYLTFRGSPELALATIRVLKRAEMKRLNSKP